jgi:hypothetical protein
MPWGKILDTQWTGDWLAYKVSQDMMIDKFLPLLGIKPKSISNMWVQQLAHHPCVQHISSSDFNMEIS